MARYYVNMNAQANGDHEVHKERCSFMPTDANRRYLGDYATCYGAVLEAKKIYPTANGCYYCARECHTS